MIKITKLGLCLLVLVLTLIPNQASLSASLSSQEAQEATIPDFLEEPRPETQAAIDIYNTKDSWPGLTVFTVVNMTQGLRNLTASHLLFVTNQGKIVKELMAPETRGFGDPQMLYGLALLVSHTPAGYLTLWSLDTNTKYTIEAINGSLTGHHDFMYNPKTDTFVTIGTERVVAEGANWTVDTIWEFNWNGDLLWEWNMSDWVSNYTATQCLLSNHTDFYRGTIDYSHSSTIYWDDNINILYLNARNLDNVWAVNRTDGKVLWRAGRNGNFTMYDKHGVQKESLWWHSHSFYPVPGELNKFILFNNNLHNMTSPAGNPTTFEGPDFHTDMISRMVEVVIDTETWTMNETWSWSAPPEYYSPIWGNTARLPNGNRLGCFGTRSFREGNLLTGPYAEGGATLIEIDSTDDIVWQLTFPTGYGIYRVRRFQPYLSLTSPNDFTIAPSERQSITWNSTSAFKAYYQITKDGELLVNNTWATAEINFELPSNLGVGTYEFALTVFALSGQSVYDKVWVTVRAPSMPTTTYPVFEILAPIGVPGVLAVGLVTVGLMVLLKRKKL